ncbi:O-antigen ligase family protein [Rubritalea tangerina]|uniref:O-antigen ligase family protein n=1 Tax=Rubritalea tangerina TaxID=430798 RepID=A0ABW4ZAN6_9BACT
MIVVAFLVGLSVLLVVVRRPHIGLYMAIAATAVLKSPELPIVREKLTAVEFLMVFTWIGILITGIPQKKLPMSREASHNKVLAITFALWVLLCGVAHNMMTGWIFASSSMLETVNYIYGICIYLTILYMVRDWTTWRNCLWAWVAGAVVAAGVGTMATIARVPVWAIEDFTGRVNSTLRNENQVPSFLLPILPVVVILFAYSNRKLWHRVALLALLGAMLITAVGTGSRTAIGMVILSVGGILGVWLYEGKTRQVKFSLIGSLGMALVVSTVMYFVVALAAFDGNYRLGKTPAWQRPAAMLTNWVTGKNGLDSTRPAQIQASFEHIGSYALLGTGPKLAGKKLHIEEVHNTYVGLMIETGVFGILIFLIWLFHAAWLPFKKLRKEPSGYHRALLLALIAGFVVCLFYQNFCFGLRQRNIWILTGLLAVTPALIDRSGRQLMWLKQKRAMIEQKKSTI